MIQVDSCVTGLGWIPYSFTAVADVAWEALTVFALVYRRELAGTIYSWLPRRRSGSQEYSYAPLPEPIHRNMLVHHQNTTMDLSTRLQSALREIRFLEEKLKDTEATLRAHIRIREGEASDLYSSDARTWTATTPDRSPPRYRIV